MDWGGLEPEPVSLTIEVGEFVAVPGLQHPVPGVEPFLESPPESGHRMDPEILAGGPTAQPASQQQSWGVERPGCQHHCADPNLEGVVTDLGDDAGDLAQIHLDQANVGVDDDPGPSIGSFLEVGDESRSLGSDPASHGAKAAVILVQPSTLRGCSSTCQPKYAIPSP